MFNKALSDSNSMTVYVCGGGGAMCSLVGALYTLHHLPRTHTKNDIEKKMQIPFE